MSVEFSTLVEAWEVYMRVLPSLRQSFGFVIAWLFFTLTGITVCSQFNMAEISNMGIVISLSERLQTTAQDIMGMAPLFGAIFGLGLLIAMIVASLVARFLPLLQTAIFVGAGLIAIAATLTTMKATFAITAIAATRDWDGFLSLCVLGGLAAYVYNKIARTER
jgi:hypothetical protein